ncbi:MAG: NAD(P)-dependent oxidoreductase [Flavobacterium sp.]|nr:MAG: NAD(P)-dependent oxidoreductase [Flavobacterium sp.]
MKVLVGHTGFVGSNLLESNSFDYCFNSQNIKDSFGLNPDLLVYSGVRAEKFLANKEPEKDFEIILEAIENIKQINPKQIVLISTVDVYPNPVSVDENTEIDVEILQPYGKNRLHLENWVASNFKDHLLVRLPGLFGKNIKKNFIFDLISVIPSMLNEAKYTELYNNDWIVNNYTLQENGFYKLNVLEDSERKILKQQFLDLGFSALNFTDSRGKFQFYNLKNLWNDIHIAQKQGIKKLNLATEPIDVSEIYKTVYGQDFFNELSNPVPNYDFHTIHGESFQRSDKYISSKEEVLQDIVRFIKSQQ